MATGNLVKSLQNIMRQDPGVNGDAQRIEQMVWLFFLKVYDAQEEDWEVIPAQKTARTPIATSADLPEIKVADPVPQEEMFEGEDFLEKTGSFIGRMKWSIFRENR